MTSNYAGSGEPDIQNGLNGNYQIIGRLFTHSECGALISLTIFLFYFRMPYSLVVDNLKNINCIKIHAGDGCTVIV